MLPILKRCLIALPFLLSASLVQAGVAAGDTPPDSLGKTRAGDVVRVSDMRGRVVVITFWASWCQYCRKELPTLAGIQQLAKAENLQVVAVNTDDRATFAKLVRALDGMAPGVIYTRDEGPVSKAYAATSIPRTFLIDREGKVAYVHVGYDDDTLDDLAKEINGLLAKPARQDEPSST
jgi:thiol-disulfide isomerase/thioredoxin